MKRVLDTHNNNNKRDRTEPGWKRAVTGSRTSAATASSRKKTKMLVVVHEDVAVLLE